MSQRLALSLVSVVIAACAYVGGAPSPPPSTVPATDSADPTLRPAESAPSAAASGLSAVPPTASPTATSKLSGSPSASLSPRLAPDLESSNAFWDHWYDECYFGPISPIPSSLRELVDKSDAIVRGTLTELSTRRWHRTWEIPIATVAVSAILKGDPKLTRVRTIDIELGASDTALAGLRSRIPRHDNVWFIVGPGDFRDTYLTSDYTQVSVLRDINGFVRVIKPLAIASAYSPDQFPVPLEGTNFEDLVEDIRHEAASSLSSSVFARRSPVVLDLVNRWAAC